MVGVCGQDVHCCQHLLTCAGVGYDAPGQSLRHRATQHVRPEEHLRTGYVRKWEKWPAQIHYTWFPHIPFVSRLPGFRSYRVCWWRLLTGISTFTMWILRMEASVSLSKSTGVCVYLSWLRACIMQCVQQTNILKPSSKLYLWNWNCFESIWTALIVSIISHNERTGPLKLGLVNDRGSSYIFWSVSHLFLISNYVVAPLPALFMQAVWLRWGSGGTEWRGQTGWCFSATSRPIIRRHCGSTFISSCICHPHGYVSSEHDGKPRETQVHDRNYIFSKWLEKCSDCFHNANTMV